MKHTTINRRFYIGSSQLISHAEQEGANPKYAQPDLLSAIDAAERRLAADPSLKEVSVVEIIAIVRRRRAPVEVEYVTERYNVSQARVEKDR